MLARRPTGEAPMIAKPLALASAALLVTGLLTACGGGMGAAHDSSSGTVSHGSGQASGQAGDIAFAQQMIPHHAQALEMAKLATTRASSPEVKALAAQVTAAQDPEVRVLNTWLTAWGSDPMPGMDASDSAHDMHAMDMGDGMMSQQDMDALAAANGTAFDTMWLEMMVAHHEGAVTMARQILESSANPEVTAFAQKVIEGQTVEIAEMERLLAT